MKKKISNEHNELERTHVARVRFSSYQFVAFFIFIYDPGFIADFVVKKIMHRKDAKSAKCSAYTI